MRVYNYKIIDTGDMSAASITSSAVTLDQIYGFAIQSVVTGGPPTGNLLIQGSCDEGDENTALPNSGVVNWTTVSTTAVSAAGTLLVNMDAQHYKWVRVMYTRTAGSGTLNVRINSKGV